MPKETNTLREPRLLFLRTIYMNYQSKLLPPDEKKVHQLLTDAQAVEQFIEHYQKHPTPLMFLVTYFYCFLAKAECRLISQKSIKKEVYEPVFYQKMTQYLNSLDNENQTLGKVIFSLMKVDFNLPERWDFSNELSIQAFSKAFYDELYYSGVKHLSIFSGLKNQHISEIEYTATYLWDKDNILGKKQRIKKSKAKTMPPESIEAKEIKQDIQSRVKLWLLYSSFSDIRKFKKVLDFIPTYYHVVNNYELVAQCLNPSRVLDYQLTLIATPEIEQRKYTYIMNGVEGEYTLREIAKYNTMDKKLSANIGRNQLAQDEYGLNSTRCSTFSELCDNFYADEFLSTKMLDFMRQKSAKAKQENKAIWLNQVMQYTVVKTDETCNSVSKRHKI